MLLVGHDKNGLLQEGTIKKGSCMRFFIGILVACFFCSSCSPVRNDRHIAGVWKSDAGKEIHLKENGRAVLKGGVLQQEFEASHVAEYGYGIRPGGLYIWLPSHLTHYRFFLSPDEEVIDVKGPAGTEAFQRGK